MDHVLLFLAGVWLYRAYVSARSARPHRADSLTVSEVTERIEHGEITVGELARWAEVASAAQTVAKG